MIQIQPKKIYGNWNEGFALDFHTISSEFLGYNEFGHEMFGTQRSEIGESLYRLKYLSDQSVLPSITEAVTSFLKNSWKISETLGGIIPVQPSKTGRIFQPVIEIATVVGKELNIPIYDNILTKIKDTPQLKDVYNYDERVEILNDAFMVTQPAPIEGKNILLLDDLFRSGATFNAITQVINNQGRAGKIFVLALTKTRRRS